MHVLQSNREREFLSQADFIDLRFDLLVAILPLLTSCILSYWFDCRCTDRMVLWFSASQTGKSSIANYRRHTQSIAGPELSSDSIQLSRNQNRSNAATQSNAKKKRNNLFLCSLLRNHNCIVLHHNQLFPLHTIYQKINVSMTLSIFLCLQVYFHHYVA